MKYYKSILLLLITPLFISGVIKKNRNFDNITVNKVNKPMSNVECVTLANSSGTVTIDNKNSNSDNLSAYEVRFTYTGYTSFQGDAADCPIRSNGIVKLTGLLEGAENVPADDDIIYTGNLQLDIDIDICSTTAIEAVGGGYPLCSITVTGSGPVKTELAIYYDKRGGYIQTNDTTSRGFRKNAVGTCDPGQIAEERKMIPIQTIANVFNGLELPMLTERTLKVGLLVRQDVYGLLVLDVLRKLR